MPWSGFYGLFTLVVQPGQNGSIDTSQRKATYVTDHMIREMGCDDIVINEAHQEWDFPRASTTLSTKDRRTTLAEILELPTVWIPHSYPACSQHAANEHLLGSVAREALQLMAGVLWDLGDDFERLNAQ
ncbi:hypothetical protein AFK24_29185 [Pseudomonas syringae]|uniref:Uncharacterized protein n=1 Tax=Pseudomonas syringae TaxID=317 RepID=A0A1C7YXZ5_PSESX|nr:hypothetical protein AFK24_29185 [Pseudomonas syringae]